MVPSPVPRVPAATRALVPRIDVSPILAGGLEGPDARRVRSELRAACSGIGFVTVTGHGVPREHVAAAVSACERFMSLPEAVKREASPRRWNPRSPNVYRGYFPSSVEGKEGLDVGEPGLEDPTLLARPFHERNRFPSRLGSDWREPVERYFGALSALGSTLLRALVTSLGGSPDRVDAAFARPASLSTLRFNFYPERDRPVAVSKQDGAALSCQAHVDSGFLTLLHQDDRGGLQVAGADGRWHDVEPDADAFVVNIGLALQRLSGGALAATRHRVLYARRRRISIPFFLEPGADFVLEPGALGLSLEPGTRRGPGAGRLQYEDFLRESLSRFSEYAR